VTSSRHVQPDPSTPIDPERPRSGTKTYGWVNPGACPARHRHRPPTRWGSPRSWADRLTCCRCSPRSRTSCSRSSWAAAGSSTRRGSVHTCSPILVAGEPTGNLDSTMSSPPWPDFSPLRPFPCWPFSAGQQDPAERPSAQTVKLVEQRRATTVEDGDVVGVDAQHIVRISKTTYGLATPHCLDWRHGLQ